MQKFNYFTIENLIHSNS